jgi:hypothetical protein
VAEGVDGVGDARQAQRRVAEGVAEQRLAALHLPVDRRGVGVEQELVRVAPVTLRGVVGAVDAVAVALTGLDRRQVHVPHEGIVFGHLDAIRLGAVVGDETQLDALGDLGEQREVDPRTAVGRPQGVGLSGPDLHQCLHKSLGGDERVCRPSGSRPPRRTPPSCQHTHLPRCGPAPTPSERAALAPSRAVNVKATGCVYETWAHCETS